MTTTTITSVAPSRPVIVETVSAVETIGSMPLDIGPLPDGMTPKLSADDVSDLLRDDPFFSTPQDLDTVSIEVGLIRDHSLTEESSSNDPAFPGYVVEGGHSICARSGPVGTDAGDRQSPCHEMLIINGDTGDVLRIEEIGDPLITYRTIGSVIEGEAGQAMIVYSQLDSLPPQVGYGIPIGNWNWDLVDSKQSAGGTTWTEQPTEFVGTWDGSAFRLTQDPKPTEYRAVELGSLTPDCDTSQWVTMLSTLDATALGIVSSSDDAWDGRCGVHITALVQTPRLTAALEPFGDAVTVEYELIPIDD